MQLPTLQNHADNSLQLSIGENGNHSGTSAPTPDSNKHELHHQFTNSAPGIATRQGIEPIGKSTNSPPTPPLAEIVCCKTWEDIVKIVDQNAARLVQAAKAMNSEQRQNLTHLLATHLCKNPAFLTDLAWIPTKLRDKALKKLKFTLQQIGGLASDVRDACLEYVPGCKFNSVEHLGLRLEKWIFETPQGTKIPVFGVEAIKAIAFDAE